MKPSVTIMGVRNVGPSESHVTFRMSLGKDATEFTVVATVHAEPGPGRHPFTRGGRQHWIAVTGASPVLAPALAEALARRERGEFDSLTTDNRLMRFLRKPVLRLRNHRLRRVL